MEQFSTAGVQVVVLAMGEPKHIKRYCGKLAPSLTCLARDDETAYDAYGLREGDLKAFASMDVIKAGLQALLKGHMQGKGIGNLKMLPGTFIVNTSGEITYTYYSEHAGDHPEIDILLAEAQQAKEDKINNA